MSANEEGTHAVVTPIWRAEVGSSNAKGLRQWLHKSWSCLESRYGRQGLCVMWLVSGASLHPFSAFCIQCSQRRTGQCNVISMEFRYHLSSLSWSHVCCQVQWCLSARQSDQCSVARMSIKKHTSPTTSEAVLKGSAQKRCHMCEHQFSQESCQCQWYKQCAESLTLWRILPLGRISVSCSEVRVAVIEQQKTDDSPSVSVASGGPLWQWMPSQS